MNLDRSLIKQQARTIIKNKVMKLFLTFFIVTLCISAINIAVSVVSNVYNMRSMSNYSDFFDDYDDYYSNDGNSDFGYFDDFSGGSSDAGDDFRSFGADIPMIKAQNPFSMLAVSRVLSLISIVASILLMPLSVALPYFFVEFIKGREYELGEGIASVFKTAFKKNFSKNIGVGLIKAILMYLLTILFIIPGIIFNYSSYFAYELMCEYPDLSPWEAIKLSKKMIKGNRSELFVLDLSFIPWFFLCIFIFPIIYVTPYYMTTRALYYENFKLRALAMGKITEDDFLTEQQKYMKFMSQTGNQAQQNEYYSHNNSNTYSQQNNYNAQSAGYNSQQSGYNSQPTGGYTQQTNTYGQNAQHGTVYSAPDRNVYNIFGAPVYYQPPVNNTIVPPQQNAADGRPVQRDIYANMTNSTVSQENTASSETAQPKPEFTVTEPQEPEFTQPVEPTEDFVEPTEPTAPEDFTQQANEPTETEQTDNQPKADE